MIGRERAIELIEKMLWMTEEYVRLAGTSKSYGTGDRFHRLDIHLLHSIGLESGINVTELAKKHGISKSAVSQALRKLEKKALVKRYQLAENRKEILFCLTTRGKCAFEAHMEFHRKAEDPFIEEMANFSEDEALGTEKVIDLLLRRASHVRELIDGQEGGSS